MQERKFTFMQVCKYASMQVWKYESMHICKYANKYANMHICKYANKYANMQVWKSSSIQASMKVCKFTLILPSYASVWPDIPWYRHTVAAKKTTPKIVIFNPKNRNSLVANFFSKTRSLFGDSLLNFRFLNQHWHGTIW